MPLALRFQISKIYTHIWYIHTQILHIHILHFPTICSSNPCGKSPGISAQVPNSRHFLLNEIGVGICHINWTNFHVMTVKILCGSLAVSVAAAFLHQAHLGCPALPIKKARLHGRVTVLGAASCGMGAPSWGTALGLLTPVNYLHQNGMLSLSFYLVFCIVLFVKSWRW